MADRIKGITVEINGDTTGLSKALSGVNKEISSTQANLKDVTRLLKLDPTNTKLLAEKQRLLGQNVEQTSKKLDALKEAEKQVQKQFENNKVSRDQVEALKREIEATEASLAKAKTQLDQFVPSLELLAGHMSKVSSGAGKVADATKGISAVAGGAIAGLTGMAMAAASTADELATLAQQSGFSTDSLQKFEYAADLVDVSSETIIGAATKMRSSMVSTGADTQAVWQQLGVKVKDVTGNYRDSEEVFYDVIAALGKVKNETERDALAMKIFGKSADQLAGIIDDGGKALKAYGKEAEDLGLILDEQTIESLNDLNDQISKIKAQGAAELAKAGAKAMEALAPVIETVIGKISKLLEKLGSMDSNTIAVTAGILAFVAAISPVARLVSNVTGAVGGIITILPKLNSLLTPANAKLALIATAITVLVKGVIEVNRAWKDMSGWQKALAMLGLVTVAAVAAATAVGAFQSAATLGIAAAGIVTGIGLISAAILSANASAKKVRMMANGGRLAGGQAIVGESGAELLTVAGGVATVSPLSGATNASGGGVTYNYNFNVDNIRTYQLIESKLENERRTTRMGYVGG